jgi:hypothetical protein
VHDVVARVFDLIAFFQVLQAEARLSILASGRMIQWNKGTSLAPVQSEVVRLIAPAR